MVIQLASLVADQVHSRAAVTVTRPEPPDAPIAVVEFVTATVHFDADGPAMVVDEEPHAAATQARPRRRRRRRSGARFIRRPRAEPEAECLGLARYRSFIPGRILSADSAKPRAHRGILFELCVAVQAEEP